MHGLGVGIRNLVSADFRFFFFCLFPENQIDVDDEALVGFLAQAVEQFLSEYDAVFVEDIVFHNVVERKYGTAKFYSRPFGSDSY